MLRDFFIGYRLEGKSEANPNDDFISITQGFFMGLNRDKKLE
jgi:hypothetical protein